MGSGESVSANEFAELLRDLKERSGLSYGTLAKRLHMSTSTLHRYCNGDAVPTDYAPVERFARLCRASPQELVELHRRWVLADAVRGRKTGPAAAVVTEAGADAAEEAGAGAAGRAGGGVGAADVTESGRRRSGTGGSDAGESGAGESGAGEAGAGEVGGAGPDRVGRPWPGRRGRRAVVLAGAGVVAALGSVTLALALTLPSGGSGEDDGGRAGGAAASVRGRGTGGAPSASASPSPSASVTAPASPAGAATASGSATGTPAGGAGASRAEDRDAVPLTVGVRPYAWVDPCSQHYLIDRGPGQVGPPPVEQDAPAWVARHGAVSAAGQFLQLTVQGTGARTVVVDSLTVRTVSKATPLAWNDYAMGYPGVGCGGGLPTHTFSVALDAARPALVPEAGHQDFPFTVSESDPEVYYVSADASAYDVRWYLELSWSSGSRHGTLRVDDEGKPFRTSGENGRPDYEFPLGGSAWERAGASPSP